MALYQCMQGLASKLNRLLDFHAEFYLWPAYVPNGPNQFRHLPFLVRYAQAVQVALFYLVEILQEHGYIVYVHAVCTFGCIILQDTSMKPVDLN